MAGKVIDIGKHKGILRNPTLSFPAFSYQNYVDERQLGNRSWTETLVMGNILSYKSLNQNSFLFDILWKGFSSCTKLDLIHTLCYILPLLFFSPTRQQILSMDRDRTCLCSFFHSFLHLFFISTLYICMFSNYSFGIEVDNTYPHN